MTLILPERVREMTPAQVDDMICKAHPGVFAERRRGFVNSAVHWEWYDLLMTETRLALIAPRDHAKTEVFTITGTVWRSLYFPGMWTYIFANTGDQAKALKERIDDAMEEVDPWMVRRARSKTKNGTQFANYSRVTVAGAGKSVRGAHPDVIIGDDVLEESLCRSSHQRRKTEDWWKGTVGAMAHPGNKPRNVGGGRKVRMPPTRIYLVGTPFHQQDLLMSMKQNPLYRYRRYAAEFAQADLVDGLAVDVA